MHRDDGTPSPEIAVDKLTALSQAIDDIMHGLLRRDPHATLRTVAYHLHNLLAAESCAVFLTPEDSPDELVLEASYTDKWGDKFNPVRLPIRSVPQGGLTGHVADKGEIVRLSHADFLASPYVAKGHQQPQEHLVSGECLSLMAIPVKDRKEYLFGLVKVENKKGQHGKPDGSRVFSEIDEAIAKICANQVVILIESLRRAQIFRDITQAIVNTNKEPDILKFILHRGLKLLRADRGDLIVWDESKKDLVIAFSEGGGQLESGTAIPQRSVIHTVWEEGGSHLYEDVYKELRYERCDPRIQSQMLIRLEWEGKNIGVLNAESFRDKKFDTTFDERDHETLEMLAHYASFAIHATGVQVRYQSIVHHMMGRSPSRHEILQNVLRSVRDIYNFDAGIIYIADYHKRILRCSAHMGCDDLPTDPITVLHFGFDDIALVAKVFRDKRGYFSRDPAHDENFSQIGVEMFQITTPVIGVPLLFGEEIVGVLVVWNRKTRPFATAEHIERLEPFARLAAANIAISESERQRPAVLHVVQTLLDQTQTDLAPAKIHSAILEAVQAAGFDQAWLYEFDEQKRLFLYLASSGVDQQNTARRHEMSPDSSLYLKELVDNALENPSARLRHPERDFGPAQYADDFRRSHDLPWAVVPLIIRGKLYGCIGADNAHSRREITTASLDHLTFLGSLAAQMIANAQMIETLRASRLKDEFLQRMSHIFGTATAGVRTLVQNIRDGVVRSDVALQEYLPEIAEALERVTGLAQTIRDFATFHTDTHLRLKSTDMAILLKDTVSRLRGLRDRLVRFPLLALSRPYLWEVDTVRVSSALEALLDNAMKFSCESHIVRVQLQLYEDGQQIDSNCPASPSPTESVIHVELRREADQMRIVIRDEGEGILEEDKHLVFDDFYRGLNARDLHIEGSGLGLAIVRQTMRLHGGDASVDNAPGGGAQFTLTFPKMSREE